MGVEGLCERPPSDYGGVAHARFFEVTVVSLEKLIVIFTVKQSLFLFVFNRGDTVSRRSPIKGVRPSPYTTLWS